MSNELISQFVNERRQDAWKRRNQATERKRTFPLDDSGDYYEGKLRAFLEMGDWLSVYGGGLDASKTEQTDIADALLTELQQRADAAKPANQLPDLAAMARAAEGTELSDAQVMKLFNDVINGLLWFGRHCKLLHHHYYDHQGLRASSDCQAMAETLIISRDEYAKRIAGED